MTNAYSTCRVENVLVTLLAFTEGKHHLWDVTGLRENSFHSYEKFDFVSKESQDECAQK